MDTQALKSNSLFNVSVERQQTKVSSSSEISAGMSVKEISAIVSERVLKVAQKQLQEIEKKMKK